MRHRATAEGSGRGARLRECATTAGTHGREMSRVYSGIIDHAGVRVGIGGS
jgi:hypothetical protein